MSASSGPGLYIGQPVPRFMYHTVPESHEVLPVAGTPSSSNSLIPSTSSDHSSRRLAELQQLRAGCYNLVKSISGVSLAKTVQFIETHPEIIDYIREQGGGFLDRNPSILPRSLYIADDGEVIINCKLHAKDAKPVGKGRWKTVTLGISYQKREIYVLAVSRFAEFRDLLMAANEFSLSNEFVGCDHIAQWLRVFKYTHLKLGEIPHVIPYKQGIYMPYYRDGSLFDHFRKKTNFAPYQKAHMFETALLALQTIHNKGIVHRDLKPENILLQRRLIGGIEYFQLFITDFGISKRMNTIGDEKELPGNPLFAAPEYLAHHFYLVRKIRPEIPMWTSKIDIYALALIFGTMYFGRYPELDRPLGKQNEWWKNPLNEPKKGCNIQKLIWKMARTNPDERPSCDEALRAFYGTLGTLAPKRVSRRRKAFAAPPLE